MNFSQTVTKHGGTAIVWRQSTYIRNNAWQNQAFATRNGGVCAGAVAYFLYTSKDDGTTPVNLPAALNTAMGKKVVELVMIVNLDGGDGTNTALTLAHFAQTKLWPFDALSSSSIMHKIYSKYGYYTINISNVSNINSIQSFHGGHSMGFIYQQNRCVFFDPEEGFAVFNASNQNKKASDATYKHKATSFMRDYLENHYSSMAKYNQLAQYH